MLGYVAATAAVWYKEENGSCGPFACWRFPFALQVVLVAPLCVGMWFVPTRHVDIAFAIEVAHPAEEEGFLDLEGEAGEFPSIFGEQAELIASAPPSAEKAKAKAATAAAAREGILLEGHEEGAADDKNNEDDDDQDGQDDDEEKGGVFIPISTESKMVTPIKHRPAAGAAAAAAGGTGKSNTIANGDGAAPERVVTFGSFQSLQGSLAADGIVFGGREEKSGAAGAASETAGAGRPAVPRVSQTPSPGFGQAHQPRRKVGFVWVDEWIDVDGWNG